MTDIDLSLKIYDKYRVPLAGSERVVRFPVSNVCQITINKGSVRGGVVTVHFYNNYYNGEKQHRIAAFEIEIDGEEKGFIYNFKENRWNNFSKQVFLEKIMDRNNDSKFEDFREWILFNLV